jgi:hypothetical protein
VTGRFRIDGSGIRVGSPSGTSESTEYFAALQSFSEKQFNISSAPLVKIKIQFIPGAAVVCGPAPIGSDEAGLRCLSCQPVEKK